MIYIFNFLIYKNRKNNKKKKKKALF